MLALLLVWTLITVASACALLALLAVDEWQVRTRTADADTRSPAGPPTGQVTPQAA